MKTRVLIFLFVIVALLASACGSTATTTPAVEGSTVEPTSGPSTPRGSLGEYRHPARSDG